MEITDMILVTENWEGKEINSLMTFRDYLDFIDAEDFDDMKKLADTAVKLGRTLGEPERWQEIYLEPNHSISARYCVDQSQLAQFLRGSFNSIRREWSFDLAACSTECVEKLRTLSMDTSKRSYRRKPYGEGREKRMEKQFDVEIREILSRVESVGAETVGEAVDKAMELYYSEKIVLDAEDMKGVDFIPCEKDLSEQKEKTR
jgi:hypothetical protein